jgi:hypothetical protein
MEYGYTAHNRSVYASPGTLCDINCGMSRIR